MKYCSHCGSDRLHRSIPPGDTHPRQVCQNCATVHYQNPKLVVGCLPIWEDRVLLCRRAIEPAYGRWNIPSGYLENGESVANGARREVREEAKAEVDIHYLATLYDLERIHQVYLQYVGTLIDGQYGVGEESLEVSLFHEQDIPWHDIAFTSTEFTLRNYFADRRLGRQHLHHGAYPMRASE